MMFPRHNGSLPGHCETPHRAGVPAVGTHSRCCYSISPVEIENVLTAHAKVHEAAVVPVPDARIGNAIKAIIVLRGGLRGSEDVVVDVQEFVRARLAPYKVPKVIEIREELPRHGPLRKIARQALRA